MRRPLDPADAYLLDAVVARDGRAGLLRMLTDALCHLDSHGIDARARVLPWVEAYAPDIAVSMDPNDEIEALYAQLELLADEGPEDEYQACLARLRSLEEAEAERIHSEYAARLPVDALELAIKTAEDLLAEHEDPASADSASSAPP